MGPLRFILIIVVSVIVTGLIFTVRALMFNVMDQLCKAFGYSGFAWELIPEPIRSALKLLDERVIPYSFVILLVAALVIELALWWHKTHEGRLTLYGGG